MRTTSNTWREIVAQGEFYLDTLVRVYGATGDDPNGTAGHDTEGDYKEYATITAPVIRHGLFDSEVSIGNCISGTLAFTLMTTDTLPKSAKIRVISRVKSTDYDNPTYAEWLEFGLFWVDHRTINDNLIDLECYDSMKKGNQAYSDNSQTLSWPKTIGTVVTRIAQQMGVLLDYRTQAYIVNSSDIGDLNIVTKPDDNEVLLDILSHIGGIVGGNWCITHDNRLRFIPLISPPTETNYLLDSNYERIVTDQGDYILSSGVSNSTHIEETHPAGGGLVNVPVVIGSITTAKTNTITRVTLQSKSGQEYTYGDDSGMEIIVLDNPYATDTLCAELYARLRDVEYAPYEMTNCVYDPAAELGDWIVAGDVVRSVLYITEQRFDIGFTADASAPGEDEMEDEYPYQSAIKRTQYRISALDSELRSEIQQTQTSILATVSETYAKNNVFNTTLANDVIFYLAYPNQYGVTTDTEGWTQSFQYIDDEDKYLWVHRSLRYGDGSVKVTVPTVICSYDDDGACNGVVRLYYASNLGTPPALPISEVHNTSTAPLYWTTVIPDLDADYPYLYYSYEVHIQGGNTFWTDAERDTVTMYDIDGFMQKTELQLTQFGAELTSVEHNYTLNTEVRSKFALDPTNITLTAGEDEQGNPTGTITFNAGSLIVNSQNFTLDSNGVMTCYGANIHGDFQVIYEPTAEIREYGDEASSIKFDENGLGFYLNNSNTALIHEEITVELPEEEGEEVQVIDHGLVLETSGGRALKLSASSINLDTYTITTGNHTGFTGSVVVDSYGSTMTLYFQNGLLYMD